jgi:hypothetical protein
VCCAERVDAGEGDEADETDGAADEVEGACAAEALRDAALLDRAESACALARVPGEEIHPTSNNCIDSRATHVPL